MEHNNGLCPHEKLQRNCYTCFINGEYKIEEDKDPMDTINETISELKVRIAKLEEYKRLQDDRNKAHQYFLEQNHDVYLKLEDRLKELEEWTRKDEDRIYERLNAINDTLLNHSGRITQIHDWVQKIDNSVLYPRTVALKCNVVGKTTGLTFEEAMTAFKAGKKIRFHDGMSESTIYKPQSAWGFGFNYDQICRDHWEIVQ